MVLRAKLEGSLLFEYTLNKVWSLKMEVIRFYLVCTIVLTPALEQLDSVPEKLLSNSGSMIGNGSIWLCLKGLW